MYACKRQALRRALAAEGLRRDRTFSVLDGGCGQGQLARFYQKEFPASSYVGLDISERAITHLRQSMSGAEWYVANLSALQDSEVGARTFDVVQSFEVLHLLLDDEAWRQALAGLADRMAANGVLLVTAALPDQTEERSTYLRYRSRAQWNDAFVSLGLRIAAQRAMYYWLPSGGPANKYFRYALTRFESVPLYLVDRAALTLGVPRPSSVGLDSRTHLLTLRRA
jgi:cyclopropane fatty-acyl-phospholipid synthase-like methyltransferase